jgi:hypothetical protein
MPTVLPVGRWGPQAYVRRLAPAVGPKGFLSPPVYKAVGHNQPLCPTANARPSDIINYRNYTKFCFLKKSNIYKTKTDFMHIYTNIHIHISIHIHNHKYSHININIHKFNITTYSSKWLQTSVLHQHIGPTAVAN